MAFALLQGLKPTAIISVWPLHSASAAGWQVLFL